MDFLIIGAGRCGTTTVFNHLRQHPDVFIPPQKEVPIGDMPVDKYMETYFPNNGKIQGTITPQYMAEPRYAELLFKYWPDVKIIAILRHPMERAQSHYRQDYRRGDANGSFEKAFDENNRYRERSLYGQRLKPFFDLYPAHRIKVLYTDQLKSDPYAFMQKVHRHIGLKFFEAKNLGKFYNIGQDKPSIFQRIQKLMKRIPLKRLVPKYLRERVWMWLEMARSKGNASTETAHELPTVFVKDIDLIKELTGRYPPWA